MEAEEEEKLRGISRSDRTTKNIKKVQNATEKKEKFSDTDFRKTFVRSVFFRSSDIGK